MFNNLRKKILSNTGLLIRLDDIAANMNWHLMEKCEKLFDKHNIKPLLGVVSNNKDPELLSNQKKIIFGIKLENGTIKIGKLRCMAIPIYMILKLTKKIILTTEVNQNFLDIVTRLNPLGLKKV